MTPSEIRNERVGPRAGALALLAAVLWGGNAVFIKMGLDGMPALAMAGIRFVIGAGVVWVAALFAGVGARVPASQMRGLVGLALLFVVQIGLLNVGTDYTTAGRSTVLISAYPFFIALFAHFYIPGDRLNLSKALGLGFSFAGVVLILGPSLVLRQTEYLLGDALVLLSGALLGLRQVVLKRLVQGLHTYQVLFWQAVLSLPLFAGLSLIFEGGQHYDLTWPVIIAVLYQGLVVAGLCFILWVFLLQHHSASRLGVYGFVTPVFGVLLSQVLLQEPLTWDLLTSMGLVAAGIAVANRGSEK